MWHIYISITVLFRGAFCNPVMKTAEQSNCTVVIKRFSEQVETLEVEWNSDIHLICDASCVGPGPQPGLTWSYRQKNQSKDINIEKLFRSSKFQTYPTFHRKNELVIRDFGPNEETDFICKGAINKQRLEAKVALNGTDCLLKYSFRCKLDNKCIDRDYLCNQHNECPDGEDEVGCGKNMNTTTTLATIRIPEKGVVIENTSDESDYIDMTTKVSITLMPETDVETKQTSKETSCPPTSQLECVDVSLVCNRFPDCTDRSDEVGCPTCRGDQFQCADGNCVDARMKCDGTSQCEDESDEFNCSSCPPNNFQCETTSQLECVDVSLVCNRFPDCTDRSDEVGCPTCRGDQFQCADWNCVDARMKCDGTPQCEDGSDERNCSKSCEFQCRNGTSISSTRKCDGIPDCPDGDDEICELPLICSEGKKVCKDLSKCIDDSQLCNGVQDCTDGGDEKDCGLDNGRYWDK